MRKEFPDTPGSRPWASATLVRRGGLADASDDDGFFGDFAADGALAFMKVVNLGDADCALVRERLKALGVMRFAKGYLDFGEAAFLFGEDGGEKGERAFGERLVLFDHDFLADLNVGVGEVGGERGVLGHDGRANQARTGEQFHLEPVLEDIAKGLGIDGAVGVLGAITRNHAILHLFALEEGITSVEA